MPTDEEPDAIHIQSDEQLRAVASHTRHRILRVLRDKPATITQVAERLGIAKGSSNHHMKVLAKAGLVAVVETRKVGGVTEQYYAMTGRTIELPETGAGQPEMLMRHALADIEAAPPSDQRTVFLKHARLSPEAWVEFNERLQALIGELHDASDPTQPAADLFVAFYRPKDV
ncbi:transcriptional regulator, ArsR family [Catenulispora acidiphila DSM 44928]|uniref:Transcriptional regulator, ArsR family n=1 Tax=Catenulispora acidiphila (strain DSM 44928 / JCM 14897 / NBRC 102108 / NRRL B-24433 / ID139908) TaxID=479433 RepID=C7QJ70_CATAD|nr:winged helix-turn-helix domain-containing protein [Catenulispora acidiphila]ACU69212.1 transcriptional regulator, ArsR family [Catenulispora acidiphila DSM 44928]